MADSIYDYVNGNRVRNPVNITLTEKQVFNGVYIDDVISERNFRHFQNVINKKVFGNSSQRYGKKLQSLVVREVSGSGRHHLHVIMEIPETMGFQEYSHLIRKTWASTSYGYGEVHIVIPESDDLRDGYLKYIMKNRTKPSGVFDSIDWINSTVFDHR